MIETSPCPAGQLQIQAANLNDQNDARDYRAQLDAYARDPKGAGVPLANEILDRTLHDLRSLPQARLFLARQGETAVGFATCFTGYSTFRARALWNVHDIAVLPACRGRGIGRALIGFIAQAAKAEGCCKLTLEVREDNPVAERLYRGQGFHAAQIDGQQVQYLFLEKTLTESAG